MSCAGMLCHSVMTSSRVYVRVASVVWVPSTPDELVSGDEFGRFRLCNVVRGPVTARGPYQAGRLRARAEARADPPLRVRSRFAVGFLGAGHLGHQRAGAAREGSG
jgi:hypothetical protein